MSIQLNVGDSVTLDESTKPYRYHDKQLGWINLSILRFSNVHRFKTDEKLKVVSIEGSNVDIEDSEGYTVRIDEIHLKLVEKKQENIMKNVQNAQTVQSPITLEEAKANIGNTVYFIESSQPYSHLMAVWGDAEENIEKMEDVIEGEIMYVDDEDVHVRYKASFGDFDSSDFNPKHLSFTPLNQEEVADESFTFKQMLEHISNGGHAQVFTDKTANLAYHKWHDIREYAIGELEEYSKFRKVVQLKTPQNKTYLTKEDLQSLLEQLK